MWITYLIYLTAMHATVLSASNCRVKGSDPCQFEVICETFTGGVPLSTCNAEPYTTFTMTGSSVPTLSAAHFGSTNFDSRVRHFRAVNNSWTTIEALTFRYYAKVLIVDLSNNKIQTIRNEAFRNLYKMALLNLSGNAIEELFPNSFYISDSRASDLATLDLSHNRIRILSTALNQLPNLLTVFLQYNQLISLPDDSFSDLKSLYYLSLHHNFLKTINMTLVHLKNLTYIDLSFNSIDKLSGYELNRVISLEAFNASNNQIKSVESNCFNQAFNLQSVDFSFNNIESSIDNVMFINNIKLNYLNLYNNSISRIEDNAFQHNVLNYLNLEVNNITNDISKATFSGLKNLTSLNLSNQSIKKLKNNSFSETAALIYLNISRNKILEIEKDSFVSSTNVIQILDLSYNNISDLGFLVSTLPYLVEFYLNKNNIAVLKQGTFNNQGLLKKIDISMNKVKKLESSSLPLSALQYLNVTGNLIEGNITSNTFSPAKYLRSLQLTHFKINAIHSDAFINMPVVTKFNLSNNGILYIDANNFKDMKNLYSLDLSNNNISKLEINNSILTSLKAVWLNNNKFQSIKDAFVNGSDVMYLDISYNSISNVTDKVFETLKQLKVLNLSYNKITSFNNNYTHLLTNLVDLRLSSNKLEFIDLSNFKEIVNVDLSYNNLKSVNVSFFLNLDYLQSLDLSHNAIIDLYPGTFKNVIILKHLNVSSNQIKRLRYGSLKGLHRTEVLDISKNTLEELDVDVLHDCTELRRLIIDDNHITSLDIERLVLVTPKISVISLGGNPMSCKEIVRNMRKFNRTTEVTSMNKVYHEDNVHGIQCGDDKIVTTDKTETVAPSSTNDNSHTTALLVWCSVLTLLILVGGAAFYFYKKGDVLHITREFRSQSSASLELNGSEFQRDLLT